VAAILLLVLLLARGRYTLASVAALAVCVNGVLVIDASSVVAASVDAPKQDTPLRLRFANANVLFHNKEYGATLNWLESTKPDLAVLVEVTPDWVRAMTPLERRLPHSLAVPREKGEGLALYSRFRLDESEILYFGKHRRIALAASLTIEDHKITVVAAHPFPPGHDGKTGERDVYLNELAVFLRSLDGPVILAGDLNTTPWSYSFQDLVQSLERPSTTLPATWPSFLGSFGIPIDHLLGKGVQIHSLRTGPRIGSDHLPLMGEVIVARSRI
jgi:endonuclease/exonuclease/phosphatase (EEP) superfamily protein YafD